MKPVLHTIKTRILMKSALSGKRNNIITKLFLKARKSRILMKQKAAHISLLILFIMLLTSAATVHAQVQKPPATSSVLNLQECLRIGLQNNFDLQIVRNEELIS